MLRTTIGVLVALFFAMAPLGARADDANRFLAEEHFESVHSFKLRMRTKSPAYSLKVLTYVAPDRLQIDYETQGVTLVMIGRDTWVQSDTGWRKQLQSQRDPLSVIRGLTTLGRGVRGKLVTYVGDETVHGIDTHVFRLSAPPKNGSPGFTESVWLGVSDGYPRKVFLKDGTYVMVATYSDFNAPLSVNGP